MMNYGLPAASFVKALVALVIFAAILGGVALASATDELSDLAISWAEAGQIGDHPKTGATLGLH